MRLARQLLPFLVVLITALVLVACGSDDDATPSTGSDGPRDAPPTLPTDDDTEGATSPNADDRDDKTSTSVFQETPELRACMAAAGWVEDAPPTGGLKAWRHANGGRVVVGSGDNVTLGIASEIGTAQLPANVDGHVVTAAPEAAATAAKSCLDDAAG